MKFKSVLIISALALGLSSVARAQEVEKGQIEALGFVGGINNNGGATVGGGLQYGLHPRWLVAGELGWADGSPFTNWLTIDANVHYLLPLKNNPRLTLYGLAGVGIIHATINRGFFARRSDTNAGLNLGGGARWAIGKSWGLRPEIKFLIANNINTRFSLGIYKTF